MDIPLKNLTLSSTLSVFFLKSRADQPVGERERSGQPAGRGAGRPAAAALLQVAAGRAPPPSAPAPAPRGGEAVRPEVPEPLGPREVEPLGEGAAHAALEVAEDVHPPDVQEVVVLRRLAPGKIIWLAFRNDIFATTKESGSHEAKL